MKSKPPRSRPDSSSKPDRSSQAQIHVVLVLETEDLSPPLRRWLPPRLRRLASLAGVSQGRLTVIGIGNAQMSQLHSQYSGQKGTTDVLTFDQRFAPSEPLHGDIFIGLKVAARQARLRRHPARVEALLYALHGMLHLLGYDDHTPADYARMHRREDELLNQIGLGSVYAGPASPPRKGGKVV